MPLNIKRLLIIDFLSGIRLVAGKEGENRSISDVNIMDNPDTANWLKKGELLLTTGYSFKDDIELQKKIIRDMAKINCSGLGIKVKRYFEHIPVEMIEEANRYGLPLIEIPYEYSLSQISNVVYREILNFNTNLLLKSEEIHKKLTEVALRGGNLEDIASAVVNLIKNPIIILDSNWRLLTYKDSKENLFPLEKYMILEKGRQVFSSSFTRDIPTDVVHWEKSIQKEYLFGGRPISCRIRPIAADGKIYGFFAVWECVVKLKKIDFIALEHASTITALERIKEKAIEETRSRIRTDFLDDLLAGKIESINAINNLGELHGLDTAKQSVCLVLKIDQYEKYKSEDFYSDKKKLRQIKRDIQYLADQEVDKYERSLVTVFRGNQVIILIQMRKTEDIKNFKDFYKEFANNLKGRLDEKIPEIDVSIGIGKVYESILDLSKSYNEALEAISIGKNIGKVSGVSNFDDFMIYHLLNCIVNKNELDNFYKTTVGKLVQYDRENNTNLVKTLEVYFECKGNTSEAAKEMFMHRNTLIYRLDKIKNILNIDLEDAEGLLEIQLGLRSMRLLGVYQEI